jgi:hypothetical protein
MSKQGSLTRLGVSAALALSLALLVAALRWCGGKERE